MSQQTPERLYNLLPSIYRQRDAAQGEPLRTLLAVVETELHALEADIDGLYDNWFIETCDEWVVPYIAELLGIGDLSDEKQWVFSQRARVANTISYRRRKGTIATLERIARDVTGWYARGVEFLDLVAATQHLHRVRLDHGGLLDLGDVKTLGALGRAFEAAPHTADVRRIASNRGRFNIPNVGLFLWRLQSYAVMLSPARALAEPSDGRFTVHPLGLDTPLFNQPQTETEIIHAAGEINLPGPIRPGAFRLDQKEYRERYEITAEAHRSPNSTFYGPSRSLLIIKDGSPVPVIDVVYRDLREWDQPDWTRPPTGKVAVDVHRGRLAFAEGEEPTRVAVSYNYGFSADIGGGPYDRHQTLADPQEATWHVTVAKGSPIDTLQKALNAWNAHCDSQDKPKGLIRISDNGVYGGAVSVALPGEGRLVIEAVDGTRPCVRLVGNMNVAAPLEGGAALILNGLLIEGRLALEGNLALRLTHSTLVPGRMQGGAPASPNWDTLTAPASGAGNLAVTITHSIVGSVRLPAECKHLTIQDSIVDASSGEGTSHPAIAGDDAGSYGPPATLERTTIFGAVHVKALALASEAIFTDRVTVERRQTGCVRYCFVPEGSRTPRRFRCQPDLEVAAQPDAAGKQTILERLVPAFTSTQYGQPAYAQLHAACPKQISTGAEDGAEMGVFSRLKQRQREDHLHAILDEYLPFGLDVGLFYVT